MPDASAAEAAERKRVMEAVAKFLNAAGEDLVGGRINAYEFAAVVWQAITELRTPVGRGRTE